MTEKATENATDSTADKADKFGYLLIVEGEDQGLTGGYLIVSDRGRPLEFHCTETIHPNRAQEILFGSTLRPYLIAEQIGGALLKRAQFKADLLIVNDEVAIEAGERQGITTVCLKDERVSSKESTEANSKLEQLAESIDLNEPFGRVREAVLEACRFHRDEGDHGDSHVAA